MEHDDPWAQGVVHLEARLPDTGQDVTFYAYVRPELAKDFDKHKTGVENWLENSLKDVRLGKPFALDKIAVQYNFEEKPPMPPYGNTLVEIHLPYCLHVPNGTRFTIRINEQKKALVICEKVWTAKAAGSSIVDFWAEDDLTFFNTANVITPIYPAKKELGWDLDLIGQNVEKITDPNGHFRYTKLQLFTNTKFAQDHHEKILDTEAWDKITELSIDIVNFLLDAYRYESGEFHVERLGALNIVNIYFIDGNVGFYPMHLPVQGGMLNRSNKEIEKMKKRLGAGEAPPLSELLLLNAQSNLEKRIYPFAVIFAFQALDIFLENYLRNAFKEQGLSDREIKKRLNQVWNTRERLKKLIFEVTGHSIVLEKPILWSSWRSSYKDVRNKVVHFGEEASKTKAEGAVLLNKEMITWLKELDTKKIKPSFSRRLKVKIRSWFSR